MICLRAKNTRDSILIWFKIAKIHNKNILTSNKILKEYGITLAQFDVIAQLGIKNELTQNELTDKLLVTKANTSQILLVMEQKNLIKRKQEWKTKYVSLTSYGEELHDQILPIMENFQTQTFSNLTDEERETLLVLLRKIEK